MLLSDGEDTASLATEDQVLELAREAEIAVYSISLRPDTPRPGSATDSGRAKHFLTDPPARRAGRSTSPTGCPSSTPSTRASRTDLRSQYTLGYVSSNARATASWRRIMVRTPDREGLRSRHKTGYYGAR